MNSRYKVRTATFLTITLGMLLTACGGQETAPEEIPTAGEVDLVLTNGKVFVADADFSIVNTVVVNDGLIVAS